MDLIESRSSTLIRTAYKKLVLPDVSIKLCNIVVVLVDSLIAARFIGMEAMSAIALVSPLLIFEACMHDLFCSGTSPVLIRYKSRGLLKEANRAFASILANIALCYAIIAALLLLFLKNILGFFTDDAQLIANSMLYFIPLALAEPLCELGLCCERGFVTDGKYGFFGLRGIITNAANIAFCLLAVLIFKGGILGISIASVLASLLGYAWSFSYLFHKDCSIKPDFSVLRKPQEVKGYIREEMKIGGVYALDDGLLTAASALFSKAVICTGGSPALAALGISNAICNIIDCVNGAIKGSGSNLVGLFHADNDQKGVRISLKSAVLLQTVFSIASWILVLVFANQIAVLYGVDSEEVLSALKICLLLNTIVTIADSFTNLFSAHMLVTEESKMAARFAVAFNAMVAACALLGIAGDSFTLLLAARSCGALIIASLEAMFVIGQIKSQAKRSEPEIQSYSYTLTAQSCTEISRRIAQLLSSIHTLSSIAFKASILTEECNKMILYVNNRNNKAGDKNIHVDFRVSADDTKCVITLIDTGVLFDPLHRLKQSELPEEFALSRQILQGFSPEASYARVLNLNVSHLLIPLSGEESAKS